jgi:hypothetical protein
MRFNADLIAETQKTIKALYDKELNEDQANEYLERMAALGSTILDSTTPTPSKEG